MGLSGYYADDDLALHLGFSTYSMVRLWGSKLGHGQNSPYNYLLDSCTMKKLPLSKCLVMENLSVLIDARYIATHKIKNYVNDAYTITTPPSNKGKYGILYKSLQ